MKVNKMFMVIVAIITVFSLTACKKDVEVQNEISNNNDNVIETVSGDEDISSEIEFSGDFEQELANFHNQFKEEIKDYTGYMTNVKFFLENVDEVSFTDYGVSNLLGHLRDSEDPFSSLSYMLRDLNGDGINEFMLFDDTIEDDMKNIIINMSTLSGDLCYTVLNSQENMLYRLYENNVIGVEYPDVECMNFFEFDKDMNLITIDSIDATIPSGDKEIILNKYKEAELDLKKVK